MPRATIPSITTRPAALPEKPPLHLIVRAMLLFGLPDQPPRAD